MGQLRRVALLATVVALAFPAAVDAPAGAAAGATARLSGTFLVVPAETPAGDPEFAVQSDQGDLVPVVGDFAGAAADGGRAQGSRFDGMVDVSAFAGSTPRARLAAAQLEDRPLRVTSYSLTAEPAAAQAAVSHRWFVAAPSNFAGLGLTDGEILSRIRWVADYWTTQSNGVITQVTVPASIVRYTASATTEAGGCGLSGSDFSQTVREAAAAFPSANFGGTDQLLVLMPPSCSSGGTVGRGSLPGNLSFGHGYYSITKVGSGTFEWTLAHELGHNYGFGHSSLGPCSPACTSTYGDFYSVMGGVVSGKPIPPSLGTVSRQLQGITDAGEVETLAGSATRTLLPRSAGSGLRSLEITDPSTGRRLRLDYRNGTGADAGTYYAGGSTTTSYRKGVVVETAYGGNAVELVPGPGDRKALVAGDSFALGETTVAVTATTTASATIVVTVPGAPAAYPEPGAVSLSRTPLAGSAVSAVLSGWSPQPTGVVYQWLAGGSPISGATSASYTPSSGQIGQSLSVRVVASATGYQDATVTSPAAVVAAPPITVTASAAVLGTPQVGVPLTCEPPGWAQPPASVTLATAWRSDGAPVPGAAASTFTPTARERGTAVSCEVTLSAPFYADAVSTSPGTGPVAKGTLRSSKPVVRGWAKVGRRLRADTGTWTAGVDFRYRWFVGGQRVRAQRGAIFAVKRWMAGKKVKLTVVGKLDGYATATRTSRATVRVRR